MEYVNFILVVHNKKVVIDPTTLFNFTSVMLFNVLMNWGIPVFYKFQYIDKIWEFTANCNTFYLHHIFKKYKYRSMNTTQEFNVILNELKFSW